MSPLIHLEHVFKYYVNGSTRLNALHDINLDINKGEFIAITGPSGSGKSTLLNICGLIDTFDKGCYFLNGKDVSKMSERSLTFIRRKELGFIFQGFNLVPNISAFENVEYPLILNGVTGKIRSTMVMSILEQVGLAEHAHHRPDKLSGGQRQRVAIARAFVKQPALIIADEPTANLDTETAMHIIELMKDLAHNLGTTFIIATHDVRMSSCCGSILNLTDGALGSS